VRRATAVDTREERTVTRIAIVGAGPAGCGAADALREADAEVTVFEKSRGVSGRAATRRREGCRYDHGANYVKEDDRTEVLLRELGEHGLGTVDGPVWTFDEGGAVSPGDRDETKFTWIEGITQLGKRLLARSDAEVLRETRVESIIHDRGWLLGDGGGERHGPFDRLLLTPPAPQTAGLLADMGWQDGHLVALREAVGSVPYRTIRTVVCHYPFEIDPPWYALVNVDREHAIGWLSREECKPGHVPDGETLLVVQMAPDWSSAHLDEPLDEVAPEVAERAASLVGDERLADPDWVDDQQWRYALPDGAVDAEIIRRGEPDGLFFAGDWVVGEGRVHRALWNGVAVGERIADSL